VAYIRSNDHPEQQGARGPEQRCYHHDGVRLLSAKPEGQVQGRGNSGFGQSGAQPRHGASDKSSLAAGRPMSHDTEPLSALTVRGPFRGPSGYDHHVREFVRELDRRGIRVQLIDVPQWTAAKLPAPLRESLFESLGRPVKANIVLHFTLPQQAHAWRGKRNVNFTMFEASRVPRHWVRHNQAHELVIVPTESSGRAWTASGLDPKRLRLCPLGINAPQYSMKSDPLELCLPSAERVAQYGFRFLNISELSPRKNLIGLVRAWMLATTRADDAVLILKTGAWVPGAQQRFNQEFDAMLLKLGKRLEDAAPILFERRILADCDMPRLYRAATHYMSMSFGEGWDQAMMEAAATGLKLIAPAHSAYLSYLDRATARLIAAHEVPVVYDGDPATAALFEGANWWEPEEVEAVRAIRDAIDGKNEPPVSAQHRMFAEFTWERATDRLLEILAEINRPVRRWFF
jgi:glycosyltransferase involved in cell wall biosynthesis